MTAKLSRTINYPPGDHSSRSEALNQDGRWWIFNRQWVDEKIIAGELRRFAPGRTLVEMAYHVGLWNIDRPRMLALLERNGIPTKAFSSVKFTRERGRANAWIDPIPRWKD